MINTDGRKTIANGAGDHPGHSVKVEPRTNWKLEQLQADQAKLLAALERVGNDIALVIWAEEVR